MHLLFHDNDYDNDNNDDDDGNSSNSSSTHRISSHFISICSWFLPLSFGHAHTHECFSFLQLYIVLFALIMN